MSIKPSVVYIKGVHSTTGSEDIGFPNIGLDKLFEGAILKEYTGDYDPSKEYVYNSTTSNVAIENKDHFNCIKNGYDSIADGIDHYYTLNNNNYIYNTADTSTWESKWALSKAINGKELYSISSEADRIRIGDNYYEKNVNDYIKQDILTYNTYNNILQVSWDESNKYIAKNEFSEDSNGDEIVITTWQTNNKVLATTGYYLSIDKNIDGTYIVKLLNLTFDGKGVLTDGTVNGALYKLPNFNFQNNVSYYVKNGNNFKELKVNQGQCTFTTDPTTDHSFYIYQKGADWSYPNTEDPEYYIFTTQDGTYVTGDFPLYTNATITGITKTWHDSYTIYEKTAVKINYNYSGDANSLKFIFTDKNIDGVLAACSLPNDIKKYVHLTNLKYNEN